MKRNRFADEQIIGIRNMRRVRWYRSFASTTVSVMSASISGKANLGGMDLSEAKRLKPLQDENTKQLLPDAMLDSLKDLLGKKWGRQ